MSFGGILDIDAVAAKNRSALIDIISAPPCTGQAAPSPKLGIELERFVIDQSSGHTVAYDDEPGIHALLKRWSRYFRPEQRVIIDKRLFGYIGQVTAGEHEVGISISLEPGSQLEVAVGPDASATALLGALQAFDAQFQTLTSEMGVDWKLIAEGFNPQIVDPSSVPLIEKKRYQLMDAYLSKTGRYARDMMRCSASTQVSVDLSCGRGFGRRKTCQLSVALGPILSFLTDNTTSWRGLSFEDTPRMVRSRIWEQVDPARCGTVPGTFSYDFGPETYVDWLCTVRPILFTDQQGTTTSTGKATVKDLLSKRLLGPGELRHLLSMVFPDTRLKGFAEMRTCDSLPLASAASLAAFVKGLFYARSANEQATRLLVDHTGERDVSNAWRALRAGGWNARVYGHSICDVVEELMMLAEQGLQADADQLLLEELFKLWRGRHVPRDLHVE
jgi:glutamate--cysteine ligase